MATEEQLRDANRLSSLTYMISACLGFSIDNLNKYLSRCDLTLSGRDRQMFNRINHQISQLQTNLKILEELAFDILKYDNNATLAYEDATHLYWLSFLTLIDRAGSDNLCDLRFKAFIDMIGKYKSILQLPGLDTAYYMGMAQISKAIDNGKYSKEDFKNLLQLYEDRAEETKSKV